MNEQLLSEYQEGSRTAHVFYDQDAGNYYAYCFCCGNEAKSDTFLTEDEVQDWAEDWVMKQVELPAMVAEEHAPCSCNG